MAKNRKVGNRDPFVMYMNFCIARRHHIDKMIADLKRQKQNKSQWAEDRREIDDMHANFQLVIEEEREKRGL